MKLRGIAFIPTHYAGVKKGDSVLEPGSGAGNDCFVAHALVGETGKVRVIDFTDEIKEFKNRKVGL